jgi:hypothetical protein
MPTLTKGSFSIDLDVMKCEGRRQLYIREIQKSWCRCMIWWMWDSNRCIQVRIRLILELREEGVYNGETPAHSLYELC